MHEIDPEARARAEQVRFVGQNLNRPECVLCTAAGNWYSADWRGGIAIGHADGKQSLLDAVAIPDGHDRPAGERRPPRPNGIALRVDGSAFLIADLGETLGGVYELSRDGTVIRPFLQQVDGIELPPSNFVVEDRWHRVWITVSTRKMPRAKGYNAQCDDGFIVLVDSSGARIVADGLGYTNECILDEKGEFLYVNETFGRRLSRFPVSADGSLGTRQTVTEFGHGMFPDGVTFDSKANLWVTSIISNRIVRVSPDGAQLVWLEDYDQADLELVESAYQAGKMGPDHMSGVKSARMKGVSSMAFGGPDLQTAFIGCLHGNQIGTIRMPDPGLAPAHWHADS